MTEIQKEHRPALIRAGLAAAGVPEEQAELFSPLTDDILVTESGWNPDAVAPLNSSFRGPAALFGTDTARVMADGHSYATPRGVAQLTPWMFEQYHADGTSTDIYDPVASIAALWRAIADHFDVDLKTGAGVTEFREKWFDHRPDWWWLTELAPWGEKGSQKSYGEH